MRAAVLGSPIAHSLSPGLHRAAYQALALPWTYDALEVLPSALPAFLDGLDAQWVGLSLTMPLKQAVLPLLTSAAPLVQLTGAANTVLLAEGQRRGENTDVAGIVAALAEAGCAGATKAVILGGGATAASALAALAALGCRQVQVRVRDPGRAGALALIAEQLEVRLTVGPLAPERGLGAAEVVVSTTPAGALDSFAAGLVLTGPAPLLLDVVYDPWPTPLAARFSQAGAVVVPGTAMLLHQAAAQVALMTHRPAPLAAMRSALPG